MDVQILWPWELPEKMSGTAIVADVWAATTNIATFLGRKVGQLYIVNKESALRLKKEKKKGLFVGESHDLPPEFFDAGNFPHMVEHLQVQRQTVYYMSINGTRAVEEVFRRGATKVITASFVNIDSVVQWLNSEKEEHITLIPAGQVGYPDPKVLEDKLCVETLRDLLLSRKVDWEKTFSSVEKFIRKNYRSLDFKTDFAIVFDRNRYPVVPFCQVEQEGMIRIIDVG